LASARLRSQLTLTSFGEADKDEPGGQVSWLADRRRASSPSRVPRASGGFTRSRVPTVTA